jgi:hypothetical protein
MAGCPPPRAAQSLVEALLPDPETREVVVGDLLEDHAIVRRLHGATTASRWYWSQAVRSAPRLLQMTALQLSARAWFRCAALVLLAYVILAALVMAGQIVLQLVDPYVGSSHRELLSVGMSTLCAVTGGFVAACLARSAPLANAVALGLFCVALSIGVCLTVMDTTPMWYRLALALVVLPATIGGGVLRVLMSRPPARTS